MADEALDDLDASVRRTDPDRWLASRFISDEAARADVLALYAFDHELSRALGMKDALMSEIRLTWWGEVVAEIFEGRPVRRHPVAIALAEAAARRALPRDLLDAMVATRFALIDTPAHASEASEAALMGSAIHALGAINPAAAKAAAALRFGALGKAETNIAVRSLSAEAFPAVAYAGLKGSEGGGLRKRLNLLWVMARGRF